MIVILLYFVMVVVTGRIVLKVVVGHDPDTMDYLFAGFFGILWPIMWVFGLVALCLGWRPWAE